MRVSESCDQVKQDRVRDREAVHRVTENSGRLMGMPAILSYLYTGSVLISWLSVEILEVKINAGKGSSKFRH